MSERRYSDMWLDPEDDPRGSGPTFGERETLTSYLRDYRLTLELKCQGLDPEQLARRSVPPSTLSLLGLVRHQAKVEQIWFRLVMAGERAPLLYRTEESPDLDFDGAVADPDVVQDAWQSWRREVEFAERYFASAPSLDVTGNHHGEPIELRDVLVHMIEEYARHCGHADLLRECIDGRTGQ
jgi:hypothetical protein